MPAAAHPNARPRPRRIFLALLPVIVVLGLVLRRLRPGADPSTPPGFLATYAPDTLWGILITMCFAATFTRWRPLRITLTALALTTAIELSQLTSVPPLPWLRSFTLMQLLLGTRFAWTDIACLLAAAAIAFMLLAAIGRVAWSGAKRKATRPIDGHGLRRIGSDHGAGPIPSLPRSTP